MWNDVNELGQALLSGYSNTTGLREYKRQVAQYPLYRTWFELTAKTILKRNRPVTILEYGPGPGLLAAELVKLPCVKSYTVIEPDRHFLKMIRNNLGKKVKRVRGTAEETLLQGPFDIIIMMASYHHMTNKLQALKNARKMLCDYGRLIIPEVFLPDYAFDANYEPTSKAEFVDAVARYGAAQILAMPTPNISEAADQIRTAFLDTLRHDELKVCLPVIKHQLEEAKFQLLEAKHLTLPRPKSKIDIGWHYLVARTDWEADDEDMEDTFCAIL